MLIGFDEGLCQLSDSDLINELNRRHSTVVVALHTPGVPPKVDISIQGQAGHILGLLLETGGLVERRAT